ncbi:MAG: hypothetical protein MPN21_20795 [Thermoanaerobaculia bacterium]|nr:hypothetical protein [Thermoanaerobaculia bacterium]
MKRLALVLMVSTLLLVGGPAIAEMCTIDAVPAATLLLPYFEVDLNSSNGTNTIFSINNASAAPALAHVTLWTDWSYPSIDFDVFLTGYDIQIVNLRDVFENGNLPLTADDQSDPGDTISPHGNDPAYLPWHPEWDGDFQDCQDFFPFYINPLVVGDNFQRLVDGHTGQLVAPIGGCIGADYGDNIARGYITIDSANRCSTEFADDPDYFGGGDPVANNNNQLWGEYFILDPTNDFAQGEPLVHIEAEDGFDGSANGYTFYSRYTSADGNDDNREPLGATWGARYLNNAAFSGGTNFLVWRDSTSLDIDPAGYACGAPGSLAAGPSWHPLNEVEVIAFDEFENATELCRAGPGGVISPPSPGSDSACFPLETQNISSTNLAFSGIQSPWGSGWMFLNLAVGDDTGVDGNFNPVYAEGAQSYVAVSHSANGRYSVGLQAVELTSACSDSDLTLTDVCDPQFPGGPAVPCVIDN